MLMITVLGLTALLLLEGSAVTNPAQFREREISHSLAAAKESLIAYAISYADNYGHNTRGGVGRLPCPAQAEYSSPLSSCGSNAIGFLPAVWSRDGKEMDIDHVERFLTRDLWYAVAKDFRFNPSFNQLNSDSTRNLFSIDGKFDAVAVVIAPGDPLPNQDRSTSPGSVASYLEGENADQDSDFSLTAGNDRLVWISPSELMPLLERRILGHARDWLREYKNEHGHYPYAATLGDPFGVCQRGLHRGMLSLAAGDCGGLSFGEYVSASVPKSRKLNETWFANSGWPAFIYYQLDENCGADSDPGSCDDIGDPPSELTVNGESVRVMLVSSGKAIESKALGYMQQRAKGSNDIGNYLDTTALITADHDFVFQRMASGTNDQYVVIQ